MFLFFFKQKTAYELRISDWSSDVCSSDLVHAAKGAAMVKMLNTGQACISPNRMFVQRTVMQPFLDELVSRVTRMRAGNGLEDGVAVGPLVDDGAIEKVDRQVQDAVSKGATLLCGGHRLMESGLDRGPFYAPTLLADVPPDMLIYPTDTVGPGPPALQT